MIAPASATTAADFALEVPSSRNRLTVALRVILTIPHFVVLALVGIAAALAIIVGWFAALGLGRLPDALARFAVRWIAYVTNVNAYVWLLTDRYPRFAFDDPDQPVEPDHPVRAAFVPTRLNRLAVLFRVVIAIPAYLLTVLASTGLWFIGFIAWLIILFAGRLPDGLYNVIAVIIRYLARFYAYMSLVTGIYPAGIFGDRPLPPAPQQGDEETVLEEMPASTTEVRERFVLGGGGKAIVIVALILGLAGQGVVAVVRQVSLEHAVAYAAFSDLYEGFEERSGVHLAALESCAGSLGCVRGSSRKFAREVNAFVDGLAGISFPADVRSKVLGVSLSATAFADLFERFAGARTPRQLNRVLRTSDIDSVGAAFDDSVNALVNALRNAKPG